MAGIGFELKKLYREEGFKSIKTYVFSAWVTAGPSVLCIALFIWLRSTMTFFQAEELQKQLVTGSIVYGFLLSQLVTSGLGMTVTRYIADQLWKKAYPKVLASFYGISSISLAVGLVIGGLFYWHSPISIYFKLLAYGFMMEMIVVWLQGIYLSTLKTAKHIVRAYLLGMAVTMAIFYALMFWSSLSVEYAALIALNVGFVCHLIYNMQNIRSFIRVDDEHTGSCFECLTYLERFPSLFFINLFYIVGLYSHNVIYWYSSYGMAVSQTYHFAPFYDVPVFLAFLAYIPNAVYFVVRIETAFYSSYQVYYNEVRNQGSYKSIQSAKEEMIKSTWNEIRNAAEIQILVLMLWGIAGYLLSDLLGLSDNALEIFFVLLIGVFFGTMVYVLMLLLLYFDDRKGVLAVTVTFCVMNSTLTFWSMMSKNQNYGFSYFLAATASAFLAVMRMNYYLKHIDYYTFCTKAIIPKRLRGPLERWLRKGEREET